jgi:hypothetical protein
MIPLMFAAALVDTIIAPDDWNSVIIHEWGVITISEEMFIESVPDQEYSSHPWNSPSLDDKAPVVYFYGHDFHDAQFTVELSSGHFTEVFPCPDDFNPDDFTITWSILSGCNMGEYELPPSVLPENRTCSGWAMDEWRNGAAHVLDFGNGIMDRFIFYECSIPFDVDNPPYPFTRRRGLDSSFEGQVLVFSNENNQIKITLCGADEIANSSPEMVPYSRKTVMETLCEWSNGDMKSDELNDLWNTWEDYVLSGEWHGDRLLVFRIPVSTIDRMTTIRLESPQDPDIVISRFYLGMVPFSWIQ